MPLACLLMLTACSKSEPAGTRAGGSTPPQGAGATNAQPAAVDVHELFTSRCAPCHGESGHGDGPGAAALTPKPRNYTDVAWQRSVKDDDIRKTILYGGAAVGRSPNMPANPDLEGKPELDGLLAIVRGFSGK
jgi:mono/diheme cytochrome c family protein